MELFSKFPAEIQILIWKQGIRDERPRNVQVIFGPLEPDSPKVCISNAKIPSLLHACQQSRLLSTQRWKLSFPEVSDYKFDPVPSPVPRIWYDNTDDTLILVGLNSVPLIDRTHHEYFTGTNKVERIAFDMEDVFFWEHEDYILGGDEWASEEEEGEQEEDGQLSQLNDEENYRLRKALRKIIDNYPSLREVTFVVNSDSGDFTDETMTRVTEMENFDDKLIYEQYAEFFVKCYEKNGGVNLKTRFVNI